MRLQLVRTKTEIVTKLISMKTNHIIPYPSISQQGDSYQRSFCFFVASQLRLIIAGADVIAVLLQAVPRPHFRPRVPRPLRGEAQAELTDLGTLTMGCFSSSKPCAVPRCGAEFGFGTSGPISNGPKVWTHDMNARTSISQCIKWVCVKTLVPYGIAYGTLLFTA